MSRFIARCSTECVSREDILTRPEMPRYAYIFRFKGDGVKVTPIASDDCGK
jgi:hypothetical protein